MATIDRYKLKIEVDGQEEIIDLKKNLEDVSTFFARAGTAGLAAFSALAVSGAKLADRMDDIAKAFGMTTGEVYNLSRAIEASGGDFNDTQQLLSAFSRSLGEVERGSKGTIDAFAKIGIGKKELETLDDQQLFNAVVEGLAGMEDGFAKTKLAMEILGKGAASLDFDKMAEGTKKAVDPELEKRLEAAADAIGKLELIFRELQMAALTAIGPIIDAINEINFDSDDAKKAIQLLGAAIAAAFAIAIVTRMLAVVDLMKKLGAAIRAAATAQAFMVGLTGVGLAAIAASAAAAAGAYYALGEAMEDTADKGGVGRPGGGRGSPDTGTGGNIQVGQTPEERAAAAARKTTAELRKQIEAQNEYQRELIASIGLVDQEAEKRKAIADIEKKYNEDVARIIGQIEEEKNKGKDANRAVISQLQEQLRILGNQLVVSKSLKIEEIDKKDLVKDTNEETARQITLASTLTKIISEEGGQQRIRLDLLRLSGIELEKATKIYSITAKQVEYLNNQAAELTRLIPNLQPDQARKLFADIYDSLVNTSAILEKNIGDQEKITEITKLQDSIVGRFPEHLQQQVRSILELIGLENQRFRLQKTNTEELIDAEQQLGEMALEGARQSIERLVDSVNPFQTALRAVDSVINNLDNALTEFVKNGKFNFKDFAQSIISDMGLIIARALVVQAILSIIGAISPKSAAFLQSAGFGGTRANGGPVLPGRAYLVGEKGPELAMFDRPGTIIPNNALGMGAQQTTVNYNINAVDAASFRSLVARDPQFIYNVTEVGRRSNPARRLA